MRVNRAFWFHFDFIIQFHTIQISRKPDSNVTDDLLTVWETKEEQHLEAGAKNWFSVFLNNRLLRCSVAPVHPKILASLINDERSVAYENILDILTFSCCVCRRLNEEKHASAIISKVHHCNQCIKSVWSSGSVISSSKYTNSCWIARLKWVDVMPLRDSTQKTFRFWTVGRTERRHLATPAWDVGNHDENILLLFFFHFGDKWTDRPNNH